MNVCHTWARPYWCVPSPYWSAGRDSGSKIINDHRSSIKVGEKLVVISKLLCKVSFHIAAYVEP